MFVAENYLRVGTFLEHNSDLESYGCNTINRGIGISLASGV